MPDAKYPIEAFEEWGRFRVDIGPHLEKVYGRVSPLLEHADTILDLAGGDGHTHNMLPALSPRLVSLDIDTSALERLEARHPGATTVEGDNGDPPFDDASFDAAIAINSVNRTTELNEADAIARVLKPGGILVFLYDIPHPLEFSIEDDRKEHGDGDDAYSVPIINRETRTIDQVATIHQETLLHLVRVGDRYTHDLLDQVKGLLDENWMENIYENPYKVASHAKLFTRLLAEIVKYNPSQETRLWAPYAPASRERSMRDFVDHTDLDVEAGVVETDFRTDEVHTILNRPVSSLYVDDFAFPHIIYKDTATSTRVRGRTSVFTVRKRP